MSVLDHTDSLSNILEKAVDNKRVFGTSFCLSYKGETWCGASGNLTVDSQYFIASTTKLLVTAIILKLKSKGLIDLNDPISAYLDKQLLTGLHTLKGEDYTGDITIKNLLAHTSGIPDYFQARDKQGVSLQDQLISGFDRSWTFDQAIEASKSFKPSFIPNTKGKAQYSDTNFQLLGKIIETLTETTIAEAFRMLIFEPLELTRTYTYVDDEDRRPQAMYYKDKQLMIPKAMASFGPDGGVVSTSNEMLIFLEAFFNGFFFPKTYITSLQSWNRIFFPMQSGIGIHRFKLLRIFDPLGVIPELIGHSGLSGSLAFHAPAHDLFIAGTVNQTAFPDTSFKLVIRLIRQVLRKTGRSSV